MFATCYSLQTHYKGSLNLICNSAYFFLLWCVAEVWTRVRLMLKPSPSAVHYILTHFQWFWYLVNNSFLQDTIMRLVLTGR